MPIYAETPRLILRSLEPSDLPRIVELIGDWDVVQWLVSVPYPYKLHYAEEFYQRMQKAHEAGQHEYFLLQRKTDGAQIGAIGLHPSREFPDRVGELDVGYWLGKPFWQQGYMTEAMHVLLEHAFQRPELRLLAARTDPANSASQHVLSKAGFMSLGVSPCRDPAALRGSQSVTRWQLTRADFEARQAA